MAIPSATASNALVNLCANGDDQDQNQSCGNAQNNALQILFLPCRCRCFLTGSFFHNLLRFLVGNPGTTHQQPVGVHPIGGTGDESTQILTWGDPQQAGVVGQHGVDLHHLIRQGFIQNMKIEHITGGELLQIGEHLLACHAAVPRENAVGAFAAHREGAAQQMPDSPFQRIIFRSVVYGQIYADFGNLHIAHDAIPSEIELAVIVGRCCQ